MTTPRNNKGLWLSSFQQGLAANLPPDFQGDGNIAFYFATDTGALYVAGAPAVGSPLVWNALGGGNYVAIPDATTYAALAVNSGKLHVFPNLTGNCTVTLPAPTLGLAFTFIGSAGAADAQSWIISDPVGVLLLGGVLGMDTDAGAGADELIPAYANGSSHIKITIATPEAGTRVQFIADGTHWLISGQVSSAAAPVFA